MRLSIVTANINSTGANMLSNAARERSVDVSLALVGSTELIGSIIKSDYAIFRISPSSYSVLSRDVLPGLIGTQHYTNLANALKAFNKISAAELLLEASVPTPETWIIRGINDARNIYPSVMKVSIGNQGNGVHILRTPNDLSSALNNILESGGAIQQEFINDADGSDKRVFVVGNKVVAAIRRTASAGEFRANLHLGGSAVSYIPTKEEHDMAISASNALGLEFSGVDIIGEHNPVVLEVNPSPGFMIGMITKQDIVGLIVDHLKEKYDKYYN